MAPTVAGSLAPGNVGRNLSEIERAVAARILTIVQERLPMLAWPTAAARRPTCP